MSENISFNEYKNRRKSVQETLASISKPAAKKEYPKDEKLFKYKKDASGNAFVVMRLLPSRNSHAPLVQVFEHYFENQVGNEKRTYWEQCPTTLGKDCPVCTQNRAAWKVGNQDLARNRARKAGWYANILVLKDTNEPENNCKVFVMKFPKTLNDKFTAAMSPSEEDVAAGKKPLDIFDFDAGADFILKVRQKGGYANYEQSYFAEPSKLFDGDTKVQEAIFNQIHDLKEYIAPEKFKPANELKERFEYVYGLDEAAPAKAEEKVEKFEPKQKAAPAKVEEKEEEDDEEVEEVDDYFKELEGKKK